MRSKNRRGLTPTETIILALIGLLLFAVCALTIYLFVAVGQQPQTTNPTITSVVIMPVEMNTPQPVITLPPTATEKPAGTPRPSATPRQAQGDVEAVLAQMSLEQKAGQMVLGVISDKSAGGKSETLVQEHYLGGFILFSANISDSQQTARLVQDLQTQAAGNSPAIPLFIAMDNEGGRASPFGSSVTELPFLMALGAADSAELAYQAAAVSARELHAIGINLTFRPVVDINSDPANPVIDLRAFGSSTGRVSELSSAFIAGLQENGLIAVAKHFPGHGDTNVDSHAEIPVIDQPLEALQARDLAPFSLAIEQQVGGIMAGHIANPQIDPRGMPASLSAPLIDGLLRAEMGYEGVVFTDALTMGAIIGSYQVADAVVQAVEAGCDVVMLTNPDEAANAHRWIVEAAHSGRISPERIEASARRILTLKAQYGLLAFPLPEAPALTETADTALVSEIARRAIYAQGADSYPLLSPGRVMVLSPDRLDQGMTDGDQLSLLGELLTGRGFSVEEWIYPWGDAKRTDNMQAQAFETLDGIDTILVVTMNAYQRLAHQMDGSQDRLVQAAIQSGKPVVVIAAESPYDLRLVPAGQPALATFGAQAPQIEALVDALLADTAPPGRLPVDLD